VVSNSVIWSRNPPEAMKIVSARLCLLKFKKKDSGNSTTQSVLSKKRGKTDADLNLTFN
jgi:hypothetical protein